MNRSKIIQTVLSISLFLPSLVPRARAAQASIPANRVEIRMTAKRYGFTPAEITVRKGQRVQMLITATDREHGISIPAFGVKQVLKKGVPTSVNFVATKTGTFAFHCSVFCGLGHRRMKGKLIVLPD